MGKVDKYPRRGRRIAPTALRKVLKVEVPRKYFKNKNSGRMLLCDLDETTWERFPESVCLELGALVISTIGNPEQLPAAIANRHVPAIPDGMTLADLDLTVHTRNSLTKVGIHRRPQDLCTMTINDLLALRGFWTRALVDLLTSLEYVTDHPEARNVARSKATVAPKQLRRTIQRYPRPGQRLAPRTLKEILLHRLPLSLVRGTVFAKSRLCDLDETVWEHLPPEAIDLLAGRIIACAGAAASNRIVRQRRLPKPPEGMQLGDLQVETRTYNCLKREGFDRCPEDLGNLTVLDLMAFKGIGLKCVVDLLSSLETAVARAGIFDPKLTAAAEALEKIPQAREILFSDPRLGELLRAMDTESHTVGEMTERIVKLRRDPPDPSRLRRQLEEVSGKIQEFNELPLEKELTQIFTSTISQRDRKIMAQYYGWNAQGRHTLEETGRQFGMTRERIRQICAKALRVTRSKGAFAPVLDRALALLEGRLPMSLDGLQAEFDASGLTNCRMSVESIPLAAKLLGRRSRYTVVDPEKLRLASHPKQAELSRSIARAAQCLAANYGAVCIPYLAARLAIRTSPKPSQTLIRETLQSREDCHWLDEERSWFAFDVVPRRRGLMHMITKVLSITEQIEISELHAASARLRTHNNRPLPAHVLLEFARRMPNVRVEGKMLSSNSPLRWQNILRNKERKAVEVLMKHGPLLERNQFEELCLKKGVKHSNFSALLTFSPVIFRYGYSVYGLPGLKVNQEMVDELRYARPLTKPHRVLIAHGRTKDGKVYLLYRLSKAATARGVIAIPVAVNRALHGSFTLRTPEGRVFGTCCSKTGNVRVMQRVLRQLKAKAGKHLLLVVDTEKRDVEIQVGDRSICQGVVEP